MDDFWTGVSHEADDPVEPPQRRAPGGLFVSLLLLVLLAPPTAVGLFRLGGVDGDAYSVAALAFLPYAVPVAALLLLLALRLRRWLTGFTALLLTAGLLVAVVPRATADRRPYVLGTTVRVLSVNLAEGRADSARIVDLVRANHIDVLALQELTPGAAATLDSAGLRDVLPNLLFDVRPGAAGSGIASRYPVQPQALVAVPTTYAQPGVVVSLPRAQKLQVVDVHAVSPLAGGRVDPWQRELASLPEADANQPARVLVGDFNATLDHAALRGLLATGYLDAAEVTGQGLHGTWPADRSPLPSLMSPLPSLIAIDHVVVDHRCMVDTVSLFPVPGATHRAISAQFVVPDPTAP